MKYSTVSRFVVNIAVQIDGYFFVAADNGT